MLRLNLQMSTSVTAIVVLLSFRLTAGMHEVAMPADTTAVDFSPFSQNAEFGEFASAAFIENCGVGAYYNTTGEGANCINPDCNTELDGTDFGAFNQFSGGLILQGGEIKTWKTDNGNVCGANLCYAVYLAGETPEAEDFSCIPLPFQSDCCGTEFCDGFGPCGGNDQKWFEQTAGIDLTANAIGSYIIEVYFDYAGSDSDPSDCDVSRRIEKSGGEGFIATFEIVENGAATICTLLPVELVTFEVNGNEDEVQLSWSTASEYRNDRFEVERSIDGLNFERIGSVPGAGHSSALLEYAFTDGRPPAGRQLYYRLRQVDTDGTYTFSIIRSAFVARALEVSVQPNPSTDYWRIELRAPAQATCRLRDLRGNVLFETSFDGTQFMLNALNLAPGVYLFELFSGQEKQVLRLMKR